MKLELEPKPFQTEALTCLRQYLEMARLLADPAQAFARVTGGRNYRPLPGMESVPSVCLRLPTGGGKTMLAAMSVAVAARSYLDRELPLVLWLVPSDAIRQQTQRALGNPDHPYRRALGKPFGDRVRVFDIGDFAMLTPQDLRTHVCVMVGTMQSLQVTKTEGRRVYAHNENLEGHFTAAARATPGLELIEDRLAGAGTPKFSFANLLKVHRPVLILDEAHRFVTQLAEEVRRRIGAGVMIEFTATPEVGSNELYHANAAELKEAELIKLPVVLAEHTGVWQQAVREAVATRRRLAELALKEPEYVRPLLLIQAQNAGSGGNWAAIKRYLIEEEGLSGNEIAVQTGEVRELEGIDLFSRECPVTTIITVQALREGWDCSFAYVLCSAANVGSARDIEQLLGRVLRMPYAKARLAPELNKAYAHVASERFHTAATSLKDCLVHMGFEEQEARASIQTRSGEGALFEQPPPFALTLTEAPALEHLAAEDTRDVTVAEAAPGRVEVQVTGPVSPGLEQVLLDGVAESLRPRVSELVREHNLAFAPSPAQRGETFAVPRLTVRDETGQRVLFTKDVLREIAGFDLSKYPADLSGIDYDATTRRYLLDLVGETLALSLIGGEEMQRELGGGTALTEVGLVAWLDPKLRDPGMNQRMLSAWILQAVKGLLEKPRMSLPVLDRGRFILLRKLQDAVTRARLEADKAAYQELLFGPDTMRVGTDDEFAFHFPREYAASSYCRTRFQKHFYARVGEMKDSGEEYMCAVELDRHPEVKHWVRNLAGRGREHTSFWLQTTTDRFYPDFVAELKDGATLAVEYKGESYATNDDSREKDTLGQLWAKRSGGRAKFLLAVKMANGRNVREQIDHVIHADRSLSGLAASQPI